jgi:hypothetical protein
MPEGFRASGAYPIGECPEKARLEFIETVIIDFA